MSVKADALSSVTDALVTSQSKSVAVDLENIIDHLTGFGEIDSAEDGAVDLSNCLSDSFLFAMYYLAWFLLDCTYIFVSFCSVLTLCFVNQCYLVV
jgi:hypothetical protein